jgi:hypothetical protein
LIIASSRGLVEIKSNRWGTRAQLVHDSVRQYLITGGLKEMGPCSDKMVAAENHAKLFQWCQTYLRSITGGPVATFEDGDRWSAVDVARTYRSYPLLKYAGLHILYHFEVACIAGILRSSSLREFPIRQYIYPNFLKEKLGPEISRELLKPHRLFTSLLYVVIHRGYAQLGEALLVEDSVYSSRINDRGCTSATASNSGFPAAKIDLNIKFEEPLFGLLELAIEFCPNIVRSLLDHGADVNINGGASLCMAVELCGHGDVREDVVRLLLSRGAHAQVFRPNSDMTALTLAANNGNLAIVTVLLEHGADANGAYSSIAVSPLLVALGHVEPILLTAFEAYETESRDSPVNKDIIRVLLDHGADINLRAGPKQISPLQFAAEYRDDDIVQLLMSYGQRNFEEPTSRWFSLPERWMKRWNDEQ